MRVFKVYGYDYRHEAVSIESWYLSNSLHEKESLAAITAECYIVNSTVEPCQIDQGLELVPPWLYAVLVYPHIVGLTVAFVVECIT